MSLRHQRTGSVASHRFVNGEKRLPLNRKFPGTNSLRRKTVEQRQESHGLKCVQSTRHQRFPSKRSRKIPTRLNEHHANAPLHQHQRQSCPRWTPAYNDDRLSHVLLTQFLFLNINTAAGKSVSAFKIQRCNHSRFSASNPGSSMGQTLGQAIDRPTANQGWALQGWDTRSSVS